MPKMTTQTQARPLFAAKLTPHRSLGRKGVRVVVVLGGFLNQDEKSSFAKAFGTALKRARA